MKVTPYQGNHPEWDKFVREAKNATFLHERAYMDYHRARFDDASLLIRDDDDKPLAVLPAHNIEFGTLASHVGLTYGGLLVPNGIKLPEYLALFDTLLSHLKSTGARTLQINTSPFIYHARPADEILVAMYLLNALTVRTCALSVIPPGGELHYEERRRRGINKAERCKLYIAEMADTHDDWCEMWRIVESVLPDRPTHTVEEIIRLKRAFPWHIRPYACYAGDEILAGIVLYVTPKVARFQYIATSEKGKAWGAGDLLASHIIEIYNQLGLFIDLGTSSDETGKQLARGILDYKEGWGARTVAYSHYAVDVAGYHPGFLREALK